VLPKPLNLRIAGGARAGASQFSRDVRLQTRRITGVTPKILLAYAKSPARFIRPEKIS
jgi:hypothetical protein